VCGVQDLKPAVFAQGLPPDNLIRFADDFGGITDVYQGFDVNVEKRFGAGAFLRGGINAQARSFNNCNLLAAGLDAVVATTGQGTETYPDGTSQCDRDYPFRPDAKISGSYILPWEIQLSGTYQFTRGVQSGGAGPSVGASWPVVSAVALPQIGRRWTGVASRTIQLIREGLDYGDYNLNQIDLRLAKRFRMNRASLRLDFDIYNILNSSWPFTINNTFSTAATSQWRRPTNVLQHRFFKLGGQFSF
jgi:hypothetical protein